MDVTETYRHCPTCGAEYRAGFTICADCGSLLLSGPSPSQEPEERFEPGRADYVETPAPEFARDRFAMEETPVVLTSIVEEDADAFLAALEDEEIGARRGEATGDGGIEILVHGANLVDAQAVLVEFTGDVGLVDDIGADDPEQDDMAVVATARLQDAGAQASRLRARGIDVRIELPSDPQAELSPMASILVPWEQLEEARKIIGIEL